MEASEPSPRRSHSGSSALVVSGFLGSGKTTLVRQLLEVAQRDGVIAGVISNEFGELGIDASLLGRTGEAYVELEGGCVCCQLSDELSETLETLRQRVRPAWLVIETSGVALPFDTQLHLFRPPASEWIHDSLAVVVVNAEQLLQGRDLAGTFEDQVSSADLLVLNKVDLVPGDALPSLEARLAEMAPDAPIVTSVRGAVLPELLFPTAPVTRPRAEARPHTHEAFESRALELPAGLTPDELRGRVGALGALRVKGYVETDRGLHLVQGVGPRVEVEPVESAPESYVGRLVVIDRRR